MSKYADIEQIKEVIRTEWVKYMPMALDVSLSFVLGKIAEVPTIEASEDCISRAGALKAYNEAVDELVKAEMKEFNLGDFTECSFNTTQLKLIARKIEDAPSVVPNDHSGEPTEKVGEWIVKANGNNECSVCGREKQNGWVNFCGFCGAKMKGGGTE